MARARRPAVNFIDREAQAKLRRVNMVPSGLCTDEEFLRRVSLDTIDTLPTPAAVRAFVADRRPDKRARNSAVTPAARAPCHSNALKGVAGDLGHSSFVHGVGSERQARRGRP